MDQNERPTKVAQVGGSHYQVDGLQHWDVMEGNDIAYLEATASKYIVRWRKKGGAEDLKKAASYLDRLLLEGRDARRKVREATLEDMVRAYGLGDWELAVLSLIHLDGSRTALAAAAALLRDKVKDYEIIEEMGHPG